MLRFPVTQGTILVQCPVCSHRFTFDPEIESEANFSANEIEIPNLTFQPSFQNYKDLVVDLLYAPIDYLKSKQKPGKKEIPWIPILLFLILSLYAWKWTFLDSNEIKFGPKKDPYMLEEDPQDIPPPHLEEESIEPPLEEIQPSLPKKPSFEI